MAWTAPRTYTAGEVITASIGNTHWRDNLRYLKGLDGAAIFEDDLTVDNLITAGNVDGVDVSAHKAGTAKAQHTGGAGDHTHQSSGAEGAKIDHGAAIDATSLLDDDHTQYQKENLLTTAGDMPYATGDSTWDRLGIGTAGQTLRTNAGETAPEWASGLATKEIFAPVTIANPTPTDTRGALIDAGGEWTTAYLLVPQDFTAITEIELILLPLAAEASMHIDVITRYGAYDGGEAYNVHTETGDARDIGVTAGANYVAHSISDLVDVAALAVGDFLQVQVLYDATAVATNLWVMGIRLKYS